MTTHSFRAALTAGLLAATAAVALIAATPALAANPPPLSPEVGKQLQAAQKLVAAKDFKGALDAVAKAKAVSDRKPYDDYKIAQFEIYIDVNAGDTAAAELAAETAADSPAQPEEDKVANAKTALILTLNTKKYDKAIQYAKILQATNPTDPQLLLTINQAYYFGNDYPDAVAMAQKRVDAATAAGQKPDHDTLELLMTAQVGAKDEAGAEKTLEMLVADYNMPDDWTQMIDIAFGTKGLRDVDAIWLGRLLFLSGATVSAQDASMVGQTASHLTFYGDAQAAAEHGGTGIPADAATKAAADKKTIQQQIAAGQKQNGLYNAKLAETLYSYGMYPEAEAAARLAIQKGGNNDPSEAPMVLGQALAAQGKFDDALTAFGQVTGGGPATARIVRLWVDYANIKKNPPAAAPAAAAAAH